MEQNRISSKWNWERKEKRNDENNGKLKFHHISKSGFYQTSETAEYTEDAPPQPDHSFVTKLCYDWEQSAILPADHATRHVTVRIGLVLGRDGGALKSMIWPFWFGLGGRKER